MNERPDEKDPSATPDATTEIPADETTLLPDTAGATDTPPAEGGTTPSLEAEESREVAVTDSAAADPAPTSAAPAAAAAAAGGAAGSGGPGRRRPWAGWSSPGGWSGARTLVAVVAAFVVGILGALGATAAVAHGDRDGRDGGVARFSDDEGGPFPGGSGQHRGGRGFDGDGDRGRCGPDQGRVAPDGQAPQEAPDVTPEPSPSVTGSTTSATPSV